MFPELLKDTPWPQQKASRTALGPFSGSAEARCIAELARPGQLLLVITAGGSNDLADALLLLLLALGAMHLMLLHAGWHGSPGARTSVELLLQTLYAKWFWGLTVAAGILLPGLLLVGMYLVYLALTATLTFAVSLLGGIAVLLGGLPWTGRVVRAR